MKFYDSLAILIYYQIRTGKHHPEEDGIHQQIAADWIGWGINVLENLPERKKVCD